MVPLGALALVRMQTSTGILAGPVSFGDFTSKAQNLCAAFANAVLCCKCNIEETSEKQPRNRQNRRTGETAPSKFSRKITK